MFFNDGLNIEIIDVFHIDRHKSRYNTPKRPFHILAKRISGYTDMHFDVNSFRITPDHLIYIPANTEYTRQSYEDEEIIAIHFNILNVENFTPFLIKTEKDACDKAFTEIYRLWRERKTGYRYKCAAVLYEYLSTVVFEKSNSKEYEKLKISIDFIENNLTRKLSVSQLAKMCNLCETRYRIIFKKEFGISPIKYINRLRVNKAVSMISGGYYSMAEISESCGFFDQKYFNKVFKEETGKSPSEYRMEH